MDDLYQVLELGSSATILDAVSALANGKPVDTIEIEAYADRGDDGLQLVEEYRFHDAYFGNAYSAGRDAGAPSNQLGFLFSSFSRGQVAYDEAGGATGSDVTGWDLEKNLPLNDLDAPFADFLLIG